MIIVFLERPNCIKTSNISRGMSISTRKISGKKENKNTTKKNYNKEMNRGRKEQKMKEKERKKHILIDAINRCRWNIIAENSEAWARVKFQIQSSKSPLWKADRLKLILSFIGRCDFQILGSKKRRKSAHFLTFWELADAVPRSRSRGWGAGVACHNSNS